MYNDPSGESFWRIFSYLSMGFIGGKQYDGAVARGMNGFGSFINAGMKSLVIAASAYLGGAGAIFKAGSFWAAVGNGAIAGGFAGGINAMIDGTNFPEGLVKGAVIGGAVAAVSYGMGKLFTAKEAKPQLSDSYEPMDIQKYDYTNNGETFGSQTELDNYINRNIGNVNKIESVLKTDVTLASPSNLPEGYTFSEGGMFKGNGTPVGGSTIHTNANGKISKIYISPNSKGDFFGKVSAAKMEIVHEFVHANHLLKGLANYNTYSEAAASMYTFSYLKAYGSRNGASFYFKNLMDYPRAFSWRNLPKIINPGIK